MRHQSELSIELPATRFAAERYAIKNLCTSYDPKTETEEQGRARCAREFADDVEYFRENPEPIYYAPDDSPDMSWMDHEKGDSAQTKRMKTMERKRWEQYGSVGIGNDSADWVWGFLAVADEMKRAAFEIVVSGCKARAMERAAKDCLPI